MAASDEQLWDTFLSRFLEMSHSILTEDKSMQQLPVLLIEEIVRTLWEERHLIDLLTKLGSVRQKCYLFLSIPPCYILLSQMWFLIVVRRRKKWRQ